MRLHVDDSVNAVFVDSGYREDGFAGKITPLRLTDDRQRAELIKDVVSMRSRIFAAVWPVS
jgi:hypothetical protein